MASYLQQQEQHTVYIQRLATRMLNAHIYPSYQEAYKAARRILRDNDAITSITQLNRITSEISRTITPIYTQGYADMTGELEKFAVYEAGFQAALLESTAAVALSVPAEDKILRYINKSLLSLQSSKTTQAGLWADFVKANIGSNVTMYDNAVKAGFANGETIPQIVKRMTDLTDGVMAGHAEALARTGVQHYAVNAREAMFRDNDDVIDGYVYLAVLDNRTSTLCAGRSGNFYKTGEKRPSLPAHWNCRSQYAPIVEGETELEGLRTAVGGRKGEEAKEAYESRKDNRRTTGKVKRRGRKDDNFFDPSQVRASTTYGQWLEKQPAWFISETLGPSRAKLFMHGKLPISSFNDMTGRQLTLDELKAKHPAAFDRAGI